MNTKCIIFDCDGVLVDTEKIGNGILLAMAAEHGFEMKLEEAYRDFNGRNLKECFQHIETAIDKNFRRVLKMNIVPKVLKLLKRRLNLWKV